MAGEAAVFSINVEGNVAEKSGKDARALEDLRAKIAGSKEALRQYGEQLALLKGKDAETTDARAKLKAAMDKERASVNANALAIGKLGGNYGQLAQAARKSAKEVSGSGNALKLVGGPLADAKDKLSTLAGAFEGANAGTVLLVGGLALLTLAVAAVASAFVAGVVAFAKFALAGADVNRSLELVREGAVNSAHEAQNLGGIVDRLAKSSPLAKEEINKLGTELYRTFNNTSANAKVWGQIITDTLSLVTAATGAANAQVANQLKGIVERGKIIQRMQLTRQDLFGTGVKVEDVAGALAKNLKVGVKEAQLALFEGRVTLSDGVKALNEAVQKRFGEINARKMLSADVIFAKFHETLVGFTAGINLEPLAQAAAKFFGLFNDNNAVGQSLKKITEVLGNDLVSTLVELEPIAEETFLRIVNAVLKVAIAAYEIKNSFDKTFGKGAALELAREPFREMARLAELIAKSFQVASSAASALASAVDHGAVALTPEQVDAKRAAAKAGTGGGGATVAPANAEGGLVQPAPGEAFASVAPGEHIVPAGASLGGGSASLQVAVHVNLVGNVGAKAAAVVQSPSFQEELTHFLEHLMQAAGVPVGVVPG